MSEYDADIRDSLHRISRALDAVDPDMFCRSMIPAQPGWTWFATNRAGELFERPVIAWGVFANGECKAMVQWDSAVSGELVPYNLEDGTVGVCPPGARPSDAEVEECAARLRDQASAGMGPR